MGEVVVGVDSSEVAARALDHALDEADRAGWPVRVVHAWTIPVWSTGMPGLTYQVLAPPVDCERAATELVEEVLAKALARRPSDRPVEVRTQVVEGVAGQALVHAAEGASLLVLGGHAHRVPGALLGSTTSYALHHATCPVLVVPDTATSLHGPRRVVVGVDGSLSSRSALRWAAAAARRHGCPLVAVRAWLLTSLPGALSMPYPPESPEYDRTVGDWLDQEVAEVLSEDVGVEVRCVPVYGAASRVLLHETGPDDLLVVGSRGRGGFASLLLGSVAAQCSQHAVGPVAVVRAGLERLEP